MPSVPDNPEWGGSTTQNMGRVMDVYHRLVTRPWWVLLFLVGFIYLAANLAFGAAYALVGGISGVRPGQFADAFYFSVETLSTIGYGNMAPQSRAAHLLVTAESFVGLMGVALVAGLVFAKFSLPISRVVFSDVGCLTIHDGRPSLLIRMANARRNYVVEAQLRVTLVDDHQTAEGQYMRRMCDVELVRSASPIFYLSWLAVHIIDESSPLWGCSSDSLRKSDTELVVSFVGLDESLSQTIHARKLYATADLLWGHRFVDMIEHLPDGSRHVEARQLSATEVSEPPSWS